MKKIFTGTVCILSLLLFSISFTSCYDTIIKSESSNDIELPSPQISHEGEKYSYAYYEKDNANHSEIVCLENGEYVSLDKAVTQSEFIVIDDVIYSSDGRTLYKYNNSDSDFILPDNVLYIAPNAFRGSNIKNIQFNDKLIYVGCYAFYQTNIESVSLPESVKLIDYYAFVGCTSAVNGYIPSGCHSIYGFRPYNCISDTVFVAPFYIKSYNDTDFPCQVVLSEESIFMKSNRDLSLVNSPGASEDSPYDWKEKYFEMPILESLAYDCDFILVDKNIGVLVFTSWLNKTSVFTSTDGGVTWEETLSAPAATTEMSNFYAGSIWLSPDIGLLYYDKINTERFTFDPDEQLVQVTTDGGAAWNMLCRKNFLDSSNVSGYFDLPYTDIMFIGDASELVIGFTSTNGTTYKWVSFNNGVSWEEQST